VLCPVVEPLCRVIEPLCRVIEPLCPVVEPEEPLLTDPRADAVAAAAAAVAPLLAEYAQLERDLADSRVHADPARARRLGRRYAELGAVRAAHTAWRAAVEDELAARELVAEDPSFADELPALVAVADETRERLHRLLVPRDPDDGRDVILQVKAGEGGEESALFAGDLLRMYLRYAERRGWRAEVLDASPSDLGGYKDVTASIKARGGAAPGEGVFARLKYEGGVHRVQRVPVTESAGRIHTSAAGVLVLPEPEDEAEVEVDPADLRIDVFRSSGPGGQSVNTTDSAVRITHLPTGIVVSCQNEKSQLQNKEQALRILRARLLAVVQEAAQQEASAVRRSQVRTVDRSERIRTYNFPENRITDHRTGFKAYNLDQVLAGDLEAVVRSAVEADESARLAAAGRL
jgi:peptide chain release factor 1